jgi:hypothetical protein
MGNWARVLCIAGLAHLSASGAVAGQLVDATDPGRVLALVRDSGDASLGKDNLGDPIIAAKIGDRGYELLFYGCSENRECETVMFRAVWQAEEEEEDVDEAVSDWNRERRFGKAYLSEDGEVVLEMNVNLRGGVSSANFEHTVDWWSLVLDQFADELDL